MAGHVNPDSAENQLRRMNRSADLANVLHAAQLVQQQRILAQNDALLELRSQQLAEERLYRYKMWLQSPAGANYQRWYQQASWLLAAVSAFDEAWKGAWQSEIASFLNVDEASQFRTGRYLPRPIGVSAKRILNPVVLGLLSALFLTVVTLFALADSYGVGYWLSLTLMAVCSGALAWPLMYDDSSFADAEQRFADDLRSRRVAHFGCDPLTEGPPPWSFGNERATIINVLSQTISAASVTFPGGNELPALQVPRLLTPRQVVLQEHRRLLSAGYFSQVSRELHERAQSGER